MPDDENAGPQAPTEPLAVPRPTPPDSTSASLPATPAGAPRGPLVRRSVHHGAALWLVAVLQFLVVMVVVQLAWTPPLGYSPTRNSLSDLGNTACGPWPGSNSSNVCSRWHAAFDGSLVVMGLLIVGGALLARQGFRSRRTASTGLALWVIAGFGAVGVGLFPENVNLTANEVSATLAFLGGAAALIVLSLAMLRDTRWEGFRAYSALSGWIGVVAFLLFATGNDFALGVGGMERLSAASSLLWLLLAGVHLLAIPAFAPRKVPGTT